MTTYLEPPLFDLDSQGEPTSLTPAAHPGALLDAIADDWLPSRQGDRAHIEAAIDRSLSVHGVVHISHVREFITRDVAPHMLGSVISAWATRHGEPVGWLPNGDRKSGNGAKPARVWRLKP